MLSSRSHHPSGVTLNGFYLEGSEMKPDPLRRGEKSHLAGIGNGAISVHHAQLPIDVSHVSLDGIDGHVKVIGQFRVGKSTRQIRKDLELSVGQRFNEVVSER